MPYKWEHNGFLIGHTKLQQYFASVFLYTSSSLELSYLTYALFFSEGIFFMSLTFLKVYLITKVVIELA